jgi:hypothetical protein
MFRDCYLLFVITLSGRNGVSTTFDGWRAALQQVIILSARQQLDACEREYPEACANLIDYNRQLARRIVRGRLRLLLLRRQHERQLGL